MIKVSTLEKTRRNYKPQLPDCMKNNFSSISFEKSDEKLSFGSNEELKNILPATYGRKYVRFYASDKTAEKKALNAGVVLSGGQAPGGHNVIAGIYDALKKISSDSRLTGFLGGPSGILDNKAIDITGEIIDQYRNSGGFDLIGSGRTKIETDEQFEKALEICRKRELDALVVIGGDDSNTNAALLAEFFIKKGADISVIGVPKTIDGDLKCAFVESSFGFDTAAKTYSELIGNVERDAKSAGKYWHFIKLMGRAASHITLECALQTAPNYAVISEEVKAENKSLDMIISEIADIIVKRSRNVENYGVVLIPEGLIEFIPEAGSLIRELNKLLGDNEDSFALLEGFEEKRKWIIENLSQNPSRVFSSLPPNIQEQLLMDRDPHGNVQVSKIETEKLVVLMVDKKLKELKEKGEYTAKFSSQCHFFGYEGRCAFPSNFDANYCYSLGHIAVLLISEGLTGYMTSITGLSKPVSAWVPGGVPISMLMTMEERKGRLKPVIEKALVNLEGVPFKTFCSKRDEWALKTSYIYPGAIQYFGPDDVCNSPSITLKMESGS